MNNAVRHRTAVIVPGNALAVEPVNGRAQRLLSLADRLERTLAHQLIDLGPMAWTGDSADTALSRLRVCSIELSVAAAGLRTTADRVGDSR